MSEHWKGLLPKVLKELKYHKCTLKQAAELTGYTKEHLCYLKKQYLLHGLSCLDNKNKGREPVNKIPHKFKERIVTIYKTKYEDINFKFFRHCLRKYEHIRIGYTTLLAIMKEHDIISPQCHRPKKSLSEHKPRSRRKNEGDLLQVDGTPYEWFYKFGDWNKYCLHGGIDDSTGKITALYICQNECMFGYMEILRLTAYKYGLPREWYSDRSAVFCVTPRNKSNLTVWEQLEGIHDKRTQFQRILSDLHIKQILAWSPQAKGRIERLWRTVQGQLPMWLKLHNASTVEAANKILPKFIKEFNAEYSIPAEKSYRFWNKTDKNITDILCAQFERKTNCSGEFSFHGYKFIIDTKENTACKKFILCISEQGIWARVGRSIFPVKIIDKYVYSGDVPQVLEDIIYRYMYSDSKQLAA